MWENEVQFPKTPGWNDHFNRISLDTRRMDSAINLSSTVIIIIHKVFSSPERIYAPNQRTIMTIPSIPTPTIKSLLTNKPYADDVTIGNVEPWHS
jgi:hypothetical protein